MRTHFLIFFSIALLIYFSANYYIYVRGLQAFEFKQPYRRVYLFLFWTIALSYIVGQFIERLVPSLVSDQIFRVGSYWIAFMGYFGLLILLVDFVRLLDYFFHFLPPFSQSMKFRLGVGVVSAAVLIVIVGHINALIINIKEIPLTIHKKVEGRSEMKVLMVSDIHLGIMIGENHEKKLLDIVNSQKPDVVLFCGDIIDAGLEPVLRKGLGKQIAKISVPMGVYAALGNHEYISDIDRVMDYLRSLNIKVLVDETIVLSNGTQLVGRNDRATVRSEGKPPVPLKELLTNLDSTKPIIVLKHQPSDLREVEGTGVDLHLSGHTHHGQLWPINLITNAMYELSYGFKEIGGTNFYVSCGFGGWGPTVRVGNRPEAVIFNIKFE